MSNLQTVVTTGKRIALDEVTLVVDGLEFKGWTDVRVTRGIERMPSDFTLSLTENYPNLSQFLQIKPGQTCELWIGKDRVITGYVDRVTPSIGPSTHTVTVTGRGMCCELVDCMAEWPGMQIVQGSVLEVARKLAAPFGIEVNGETGPPVGGGAGVNGPALIPLRVLMIGETPWEVIESLCRIAGLLVFDMPDGSLRLAANPATLKASATATQGAFSLAASGFAEGVNVLSASAQFSADQRFSHYRAFAYSFDHFKDFGIGESANLLATFEDPEIPLTRRADGKPRYRPRAILSELGKGQAFDNAKKRAAWEAKRRWGRAHVVTLTTDSWRDAGGALYSPNTLAGVDLPSLKVGGVHWLIAEVTYRLSTAGTQCEVQLMPPEAFNVQPTLPPYVIPSDIAQHAAGSGRP